MKTYTLTKEQLIKFGVRIANNKERITKLLAPWESFDNDNFLEGISEFIDEKIVTEFGGIINE